MKREPLFIVLEIDGPMAPRIIQLRETCGDAFRASLPAEITLTGSSGVGPLAPEQSVEAIGTVLENVAAEVAPLQAEFGPMLRFPGTDLFVLTLQDETPLRALHSRLTTSGLAFRPNAFPFRPHCTVSSRAVTDEEAERFLRLSLPGVFTLNTLALYGLEDGRVTRLAATQLTG